MDRNTLLTLCQTLTAHLGVTHFAISMRALGKGDFFKKLEAGGDCRTTTAAKVAAWFSSNWPTDLSWPADIPRPAPVSASGAPVSPNSNRKTKRAA